MRFALDIPFDVIVGTLIILPTAIVVIIGGKTIGEENIPHIEPTFDIKIVASFMLSGGMLCVFA